MKNIFRRKKFYWSVDITKLPAGMTAEDIEKNKKLLRKYGEKVKWDQIKKKYEKYT